MADSQQRNFNIIVFGASGFTGQFVVEEVARTIEEEGSLKWAVAGRDMAKLQAVLCTASQVTEKDLKSLPIVIADVDVQDSLQAMCRQTDVVLNCVGPYSVYGTAVVKACIDTCTHHIDICGEPAWLEKMHVMFGSTAEEKGVCILEACGFDSIPAEMGFLFTKNQFDGDANGVECFVSVQRGPEGGCGNYGTWLSAINGFANRGEIKTIRRELYKEQMPRSSHRMPKRAPLFHNPYLNTWCLPFPGADRSVVNRSEYFSWLINKTRPVQFEAYYSCSGLMEVLLLVFVGLFFVLLTKFSAGISLLKSYPKLLSFGTFSKTGPTRKQIAGTTFTLTFIGRGYTTRVEDLDQVHSDTPTQNVITHVTGPEPGYVTTPICMVQAAYVLLSERQKLPSKGGVLTPRLAFANTKLLDRLQKRGLQFRVIEKC